MPGSHVALNDRGCETWAVEEAQNVPDGRIGACEPNYGSTRAGRSQTPTDLVGPCRCIEAFLKIETAKYPVVRVIADCGRSTPSSVLTLSPWQSRTMLCFRGQAGEKGATTCTHARHERERQDQGLGQNNLTSTQTDLRNCVRTYSVVYMP